MIYSDFAKALTQVFDPRFLKVLLKGIGLTIALLIGFYFGLSNLLSWLLPDSISIFGYQVATFRSTEGWDTAMEWLSLGVVLLMSIFLMVPVASAFTGIFLDDIASAVEDKHYPHLPPAPKIPMSEVIGDTLGFLGILVLANLLALIAYVILLVLFLGFLAPVMFIGLNGYLLGREYYQMVAMRRLGKVAAKRSRSRNAGRVWWAGILMTLPLSIPLINILVPILACATFTHQFHRLETSNPPQA